jgi:hypothetical protein
MEPNNNLQALSVVDRSFANLAQCIDALDLWSDKLQASRSRLSEIDGEISQIKTDAESLERSKRISRLSSLNSAREIAQADDSAIVAKIVIAKSRVVEAGRTSRNLIGSILFQLAQVRKLNAMALLEKHFEIRKIPVRLADIANNARNVVQTREWEETLTKPSRNRDEEIGSLYVLKAKFEPVRVAVLNEENLALELPQTATEELAVAEPAAELQPVAV